MIEYNIAVMYNVAGRNRSNRGILSVMYKKEEFMGIKYKVFISSTYEDMKEERDEAFKALLTNGNIVGGMEYFPGDNIEKFKVIKRDIDDADIFILILGGRYGTICPETGKSFVQMEYEYAKSLKIPVGVFAIKDDYLTEKKIAALKEGKHYYDNGGDAYDRFYKLVSGKMMCLYSNLNELTRQLLSTVNQFKNNYPLDGWIRCDTKSIGSYLNSMDDDNFIRLSGRTIVKEIKTSEKDQYRVSESLFYGDIESDQVLTLKNIYLIQRSSSLVLGAESGWRAENDFLSSLRKAIQKCENFYHVITLEGIESHIRRPGSTFPDFKDFTKYFKEVNGYAALKKENSPDGVVFIKKLPQDGSTTLFKLDRQVRLIAIERYDGVCEGVFVWNIGNDESCMKVSGKEMKKYLKRLIRYYEELANVEWKELNDLYEIYLKEKKCL